MRKLACLAVVLFVCSMSIAAFAGSQIPSLKGTWVYKAFAIAYAKNTDASNPRHGVPKSGEQQIDFTLTIDKQDGFRFSGIRASAKYKEAVVGVIGFDNKTVYMADSDGMSFCKIISPDKMEHVYLHATKYSSVAARGIMNRKR